MDQFKPHKFLWQNFQIVKLLKTRKK